MKDVSMTDTSYFEVRFDTATEEATRDDKHHGIFSYQWDHYFDRMNVTDFSFTEAMFAIGYYKQRIHEEEMLIRRYKASQDIVKMLRNSKIFNVLRYRALVFPNV